MNHHLRQKFTRLNVVYTDEQRKEDVLKLNRLMAKAASLPNDPVTFAKVAAKGEKIQL